MPGMLIGVDIRSGRTLHLLLFLACEVLGATTVQKRPGAIRQPTNDQSLLTHKSFRLSWEFRSCAISADLGPHTNRLWFTIATTGDTMEDTGAD
jgi:hypothetical protein